MAERQQRLTAAMILAGLTTYDAIVRHNTLTVFPGGVVSDHDAIAAVIEDDSGEVCGEIIDTILHRPGLVPQGYDLTKEDVALFDQITDLYRALLAHERGTEVPR